MAIKIAQLRTFATVSRCGNIKDAADRLGRTPSAVSMTLKQLEDELGGRLFEADRKNALTPLGQYVLDAAEEELNRFGRAIEGIRAYANNKIGRLEIACVPSVAVRILPDVIREFVTERPSLQVEVRDMDSLSVQRAIERGQVEIGIASLRQASSSLDYVNLFTDQFGVTCAANSPLAKLKRPLRWADIENQALIANGLSATIADHDYRALEQNSRLMIRNVTSILAFVAQGHGVSLLPGLAVPKDDRGVRWLPLATPVIERRVGIVTRTGSTLSPVAEAMVETLLQHPVTLPT